MWELRNIERRPAELDLSSAGLGRRCITQLYSGGVVVANAVELTYWDDEVQLIVCEGCGIVHCEPGGWVSLRRAGDLVVFGPDRRVFDADPKNRDEYRPPDFVAKRGWPFLLASTYLGLRRSVPRLPDVAAMRPLSQRELVAIIQWEAPARILGAPFDQSAMRTDLVVACSEGDAGSETARFSNHLQTWATGSAHVLLERVRKDDVPVEYYLDVPDTPVWRPLVLRDAEPLFRLEPGLVAVLADQA